MPDWNVQRQRHHGRFHALRCICTRYISSCRKLSPDKRKLMKPPAPTGTSEKAPFEDPSL